MYQYVTFPQNKFVCKEENAGETKLKRTFVSVNVSYIYRGSIGRKPIGHNHDLNPILSKSDYLKQKGTSQIEFYQLIISNDPFQFGGTYATVNETSGMHLAGQTTPPAGLHYKWYQFTFKIITSTTVSVGKLQMEH